MKLILQVLSGKKYGQRIVVDCGQSTTIGRSTAAQNNFDDDHMSSLHFEVENFGDRAEVRDLKSTNRTWLNNNHITSSALKHGDRVRAGKTIMQVELDYSAVLEESGLSPKPVLLESTSQVALTPSRPEPSRPEPSRPEPAPPAPQRVEAPLSEPARAASPVRNTFEVEAPAKPPLVVATAVQARPVAKPDPVPVYEAQRNPISNAPLNNAPMINGGVDQFPRPTANSNHVNLHKPHTPAAFVSPMPAAKLSSQPSVSSIVSSPIESGFEVAAPTPGAAQSERSNSNPIVDSSSLFFNPSMQALGDKRRFREYERIGDFQTVHNLRQIVGSLHARKALRIVCHFAKIRATAPALSDIRPLYPEYPGALTHLPVSMTFRDWESESVQNVALRLCNNDALIVFIGEFNAPLDEALQTVGAEGIPGFCEAGGFFGWCWPSAFVSLIQLHGTRKWGEILGATIEGAIMYSPIHSEVLLAFAAESLESELKSLGFNNIR